MIKFILVAAFAMFIRPTVQAQNLSNLDPGTQQRLAQAQSQSEIGEILNASSKTGEPVSIVSPTLGRYKISSNSDLNAVCKLNGLGKYIPGSIVTEWFSHPNRAPTIVVEFSILVNAQGEPDRVVQDTVIGHLLCI